MNENRDDTGKLGLGKAGLAYARLTKDDLLGQPGGNAKKVEKRFNLQKEVTNQKRVKGLFPAMDKGEKVKRAFKESARRIVDKLLE